MKKLIIFGMTEMAEVAHFMFKYDSNYEVVAFCVDKKYISSPNFQDLPVVAFENVEEKYPTDEYFFFVALGYTNMNNLRALKYKEAKGKGYEIASYISSKITSWPGFEHGENCLILEGNNLQPFSKVGNNVTLWSTNHIGHHSVIEDNVFITSHVVISGAVTVKRNSFIGVNTSTRDHITIGEYSLIGAGAMVHKNTDPYGIYKGVPVKKSEGSSLDIM